MAARTRLHDGEGVGHAVLGGRHVRVDGVLGHLRDARVEGGLDRVAAGGELVRGETGVHQVVLRVGAEEPRVRRRAHAGAGRRDGAVRQQPERRRLRRRGVGRREGAVGDHGVDDEVPALQRPVRVGVRVVDAGVVHHSGEQRRLRHGQFVRRRPEIRFRRGADPVHGSAEFDHVEVIRQNVVLARGVVELDGHFRFTQLARERVFAVFLLRDRVGPVDDVHEVVLDVLLGDRRRALQRAAGGVVHRRAEHALHVDAAFGVEPAVLDPDDGGLHRRRDPGRGHREAVLRRRASRSACRPGRSPWSSAADRRRPAGRKWRPPNR